MACVRTLRLVLVSLLLVTLSEVSSREDSIEYMDVQEFKDFQEFRAWKKSMAERRDMHRWNLASENESRGDQIWKERDVQKQDPPPIYEVALMARYIVNQADWASVATISSRTDTKNYPFVNLVSLSDGPLGNGTGVLYMYLTPLDYTAQDFFKDNRATLLVSLAQGDYCKGKNYDPMDPRCSRVLFSGKIRPVNDDNPEFSTAKNAVFGRHPWLAHMPEDHHFFFAKLKINTIAVLDTFGGPKYVSLTEYFHPDSVTFIDYFARHRTKKNDLDSKILKQPMAINVQIF